MEYKLNYSPSPEDIRDYKITFKSHPLKNNSVVDLSHNHTSIKNQGSIGSCTAFATVALMEYNRKKYTKNNDDDVYSEKFTYYVTRADIAKWDPNIDSGAYMRDSFNSARVYGTCSEALVPYDNDYKTKPSGDAYKEALQNQIITFARVDETDKNKMLLDIKELLDEEYCLVGGFICYSSLFDQSVIESGIVPNPGGDIVGGHAVCIVGYDDIKQLLKFKNSWSYNWGDNGYGYLPYSYVTTGNLSDLWSAFTQENFNNDSIIGWERGQQPEVVEPDVVEPDVVEPDVVEPDVVEPDVVEPDVVEPDVVEPKPKNKPKIVKRNSPKRRLTSSKHLRRKIHDIWSQRGLSKSRRENH